MRFGDLIAQALNTLRDPRGGAQWVMSHDIGVRTAWEVLAFVIVVSAVATIGAEALGFAEPVMVYGEAHNSFSFGLSIVNGLVLAVGAILIVRIGRAFGGTGGLADSVLLLAWLQFILILLQVAQFLAFLVLPALAGLMSFVALFLLFWLPTNFIATLHGFRSRLAVFVGVVLTGAVLLVVVSIFLRAVGLELNLGLPSDV